MQKKTKVVATIGPATSSESVLTEMISTGMNVARFNTKHGTPAWHKEHIERVRSVSKKMGTPVATLLDLQGPEIRVKVEAEFDVKQHDLVTFASPEYTKSRQVVQIPQQVIEALSVNDQIILEDGACEFRVSEVQGTHIVATSLMDCTVKDSKTMNVPLTELEMPPLTEKDVTFLEAVSPSSIDFVALSFVRTQRDITLLRERLEKLRMDAHIVAKIENRAALDNIDDIIAASDAIMIARGDLGVEIPYEELIFWQKTLIEKCRAAARPVITATQMLKSMVTEPQPTRAEVSDIAHAIYDGTDAVMLSEETTIGAYPVKAVQVQAKIAQYNEQKAHPATIPESDDRMRNHCVPALTRAVEGLITNSDYNIDTIVCFTETGKTARLLSRYRLKVPIHAVTSTISTQRKLALVYGIESTRISLPERRIDASENLLELFKDKGIATAGQTIALVHGTLWKHPGLTNTVSILDVT